MLSFFPRDVLDEIWDLIESIFDGFPILFHFTRTGATKIISPSSLASPFSIIMQLHFNKLMVCYLYFLTAYYRCTIASSCRETIVYILYDVNKCKWKKSAFGSQELQNGKGID